MTTKQLDINRNIGYKMIQLKYRNIPVEEEDSLDGMSGVGGGISGSRQVERLWYLLFAASGSLSESVSPKICLTNKLQQTILIILGMVTNINKFIENFNNCVYSTRHTKY